MVYVVILFFLVFSLYYYVYLILTKSKRDLLKRLETYTQEEERDLRSPHPLKADERNLRLGLKDVGRQFSRIEKLKGPREYFDRELMKTGILLRGEEFIAIIFAGAILLGLLVGVLIKSLYGVIFGALIGIYIPFLFLRIKKKQRQKLFNEQLGEVLTTMSNALRSGHSLMKALEVVSLDTPLPAGQEFSYTMKEMQLGIPTETALKNMNERIDSKDLELMITAVLIQRQVGGNLAEVLDSIADTIRDRIRIQGEIKTLTAQGKLSGIIISIIPIGLGVFFYIINPEYITELFFDPLGIVMIIMAVMGQIIGGLFIRKIVDIDV